MSDPVTQVEAPDTQPEVTQQVTSKIPTTKPAKISKRAAAGKAVAERTRLAREAQKKAASKGAVKIANNKAKETPAALTDVNDDILNTTQWLTAISISVSLIGLYYKREEIKLAVFSKFPQPREDALRQALVQAQQPPQEEPPRQRKGIAPWIEKIN